MVCRVCFYFRRRQIKAKSLLQLSFCFFSIRGLRTRSHSQSCSLAAKCSGFGCSLRFAEPKEEHRLPGRKQTHNSRETKQSSGLPAPNLSTQNLAAGSWAPVINSWRSSTLGYVSVSSATGTHGLTQSPLEQIRKRAFLPGTTWMGCKQGERARRVVQHLPHVSLGENKRQVLLIPSPVPIPSFRELSPKGKI